MSRSLSHEVGILTLGRLVSYVIMFVVPLVNVRTLSVEEYGYYRQFWLIFETLSPMLILGFSRSLLYYLPRAETAEERSAYTTQTVMFLTLASLLAMGICAVMAKALGEGLGAAARAFYWRLSFFMLFMVATDYMEVLFVAQRQPVAQSIYHATVWGAQALVVIVASYLSHDVNTIIWSLAFYGLVKFVFSIAYTHSRFRLTPTHVSIQSMREQLSFAVPVGLMAIGVILVSQTDKFIINRFVGREAFAVYSVGAFQLPLANIVMTSTGNVVFPMLAQYQKAGNYGGMVDLTRRSLAKTSVLFFPMFVFLEVTARPFITILFTEQYAGATPIFMVYTIMLLRSWMESGAIIQAFGRNAFLVKSYLAGFVVNVGLGIALFQVLGAIGVALSTLATLVGITAVCMWFAARLLGVRVIDLLPVQRLFAQFLAAAVPGVLLWYAYQRHPVTNFIELAGAGVVYAALYTAVCVGTRLVTVADLKSLVGKSPI